MLQRDYADLPAQRFKLDASSTPIEAHRYCIKTVTGLDEMLRAYHMDIRPHTSIKSAPKFRQVAFIAVDVQCVASGVSGCMSDGIPEEHVIFIDDCMETCRCSDKLRLRMLL